MATLASLRRRVERLEGHLTTPRLICAAVEALAAGGAPTPGPACDLAQMIVAFVEEADRRTDGSGWTTD